MSRTEQQLFDDKHRERKKKETVHYYDRWINRDEKRSLLRMDNTKDQKRTKERIERKLLFYF